jgi:N-dimethylarginine dimethylaminohydrolase
MSFDFGSFNMWGKLERVALRRPAIAFEGEAKLDAEWQALNYHSRPDLTKANREFETFEAILAMAGANTIPLGGGDGLTLDSLYAHDALIVTPRGLVLPNMGKPARRGEAKVNSAHLSALGFPIVGEITAPGKIEGGDLIWIDRHTLIAGIGYRTNDDGVAQLKNIIGGDVDIISVDLPHYKGRSDVFHLMSVASPVDADLVVAYLPLMPVRMVEFFESRGMGFVEVPEEEFASMGCNVLALGPRHASMVAGNPETERRMRAAGITVDVFDGYEICRKGEGGPTCMTRPLVRR